MTSQGTDKDQLRQLSDLFWQFHNDRLTDPSLTDMTPYLQPFLELIAQERRKAAIEERRIPKCVDCHKPLEVRLHKKCWSTAVATLSQEG